MTFSGEKLPVKNFGQQPDLPSPYKKPSPQNYKSKLSKKCPCADHEPMKILIWLVNFV